MVIEVADEHEGEKKRRERKRAWGLWEKREQGKESAPCDGQHGANGVEEGNNSVRESVGSQNKRSGPSLLPPVTPSPGHSHHPPVTALPHFSPPLQARLSATLTPTPSPRAPPAVTLPHYTRRSRNNSLIG